MGHNVDYLFGLVNGEIDNFTARNMSLLPTMSTAILFTTKTIDVNIYLGIVDDGVKIPTANHFKSLG